MALTLLPIGVWMLFVASGAAALIYEIVWLQLLQLVIGSSTVSLGVLLGMFMGGMCLGSLCAPRLVGSIDIRSVFTLLLELAIGGCGLAFLRRCRASSVFTRRGEARASSGVLVRAGVAAACLLPPTFAMGATLPVMSRWVETTRRHSSWLGLFYAGNILGAVAGCLVAGFYLLRVYDMNVATYVAVAINLIVAGVAAFAMVRLKPDTDD